jgi:putative GTP pyrophosphokinase
MAWPTPLYSRNEVNRAGVTLISPVKNAAEWLHAWDVLTNWRSCHGYPMNTFQATLRRKLENIDASAIVAQRLKRVPSILAKLRRFDSMNLSRMQDIGGLRAVTRNLRTVRNLRHDYLNSRFKHKLVSERDYIRSPKPSGYRGIHLVYRYQGQHTSNYDGLLVELQIRTRLQHSWATAVETMGTFLDHALKSSEGPQEWLDFFSLAGAAFAHLESTVTVPGFETLDRSATFEKTTAEAERLRIHERLQAFTVAADAISQDKARSKYHLVS